MINLLPPDQKEEVFNEKKERIVINLMFFLVVFVLFFTTATYLVQQIGLDQFEEERINFAEKRSEFGDIEQKVESINKLNSRLENIKKINNSQPDFNKFFKDINNALTDDVRLDSFDYVQDEDGYRITLSGYTPEWESLLELEERLEENFTVNFSSDSWTQTKDISFLVKLENENEN